MKRNNFSVHHMSAHISFRLQIFYSGPWRVTLVSVNLLLFFVLFDEFVCPSLLWFPFMILLATFKLKLLSLHPSLLADIQAQPKVPLTEGKFPLVKTRLCPNLFLEWSFGTQCRASSGKKTILPLQSEWLRIRKILQSFGIWDILLTQGQNPTAIGLYLGSRLHESQQVPETWESFVLSGLIRWTFWVTDYSQFLEGKSPILDVNLGQLISFKLKFQ